MGATVFSEAAKYPTDAGGLLNNVREWLTPGAFTNQGGSFGARRALIYKRKARRWRYFSQQCRFLPLGEDLA